MLNRSVEGDDYHDQINMIPLIDVMLVLLVVFLVTAPLMQTALALQLPQVQAPAVAASPLPRLLSIDASGTLRLDGDLVSLGALPARLAAPASDASLRIQADQAVAFARVAEVLSVAQAQGWAHIAVMTSPPPAPFASPTSEQ